jgi:DNA-binding transcriptional LysR family regulator
MARFDLNSLGAFIVVARERSFTRAAAQLGVTQSALSHTMRNLEQKLGVRLLTRTTRGVMPTEAGERLLANLQPYYDGIQDELAALAATRDRPAGTIRITATENAGRAMLWPRLERLLPDYPDIKVEVSIDYGLVELATGGFDAGIRFGSQVAKDMIAVRISPDIRLVVVAAPAYLERRGLPRTPDDLPAHACINLRLPTYGGLLKWEFADRGGSREIGVEGQLIFNSLFPVMDAARAGFGLAQVPEGLAAPDLATGRLVPVLADYWPTLPGYHLYYPSRRHVSPAFALLVDALREPLHSA